MRNIQKTLRCLAVGAALWEFFSASAALAQGGWVATQHGEAGKDLNAVYFVDSTRGWIAGDGGFVNHTEDGGKTWIRQRIGTQTAINDIYFRSKDDGYLLSSDRVYVTNDGGRNWREGYRVRPADFNDAVPEVYSVRFADKNKGWMVGSLSRGDRVVDSLLLQTDDGGLSWRRQSLPTRYELVHLDFVDDQRGWIAGASGTILRTMDGGATWSPQISNTTAMLYHVDFYDSKIGWAVGEKGTVLRTSDGGATWLQVPTPARSTLLSVQFTDGNRGWIAGRGGVILSSSDGGRSWLQQDSRTTQNLYALCVEKKNIWAVGGDGLVLKYER